MSLTKEEKAKIMRQVSLSLFNRLNMFAKSNEVWFNDLSNPNNLSYWYYQMMGVGFEMPKTMSKKLSFEEYVLLGEATEEASENKEDDTKRSKFLDEVWKPLIDSYNKDKVFIKNGAYSNKFNYETCLIDREKDDYISSMNKFLELTYASMIRGAGGFSEINLREYYEEDKEYEKVYNGMPLRSEYRIFYDFDNKKPLYIVDYWDFDYCYPNLDDNDADSFLKSKERLLSEFEDNKEKLTTYVQDTIDSFEKDIYLKGIWSIDFMLYKERYILIDMAIGNRSAYYDQELVDKINKEEGL